MIRKTALAGRRNAVEPVGTIFDIKQYAIHDGPGIRTTVFFKGCPLDCAWCHNPESRCPDPEPVTVARGSERRKTVGCTSTVEEVLREVSRDEIFYDESGGGVSFSGGEPLLQVDFLSACLRRCKQAGFATLVDTCGHVPWESFTRVLADVDLFFYDLKLMDRGQHERYTGAPNDLILENLKRLAGTSAPVRIRVPMVPGITDTDDNLDAIAAFLEPLGSCRRIDLLPYNPLGTDKARRYGLARKEPEWAAQPPETLETKRRRLAERGFAVKIGG